MRMDIVLRPSRSIPSWVGRVAGLAGFSFGALFSGSVALAYYIVRVITRPTKTTAFDSFAFTPFELGVPFEAVTFPSMGDAYLRGWWLYRHDSNRVVITCGGYRGHRADLLGIGAALWRDGNNVLIFDYRGHGELAGTLVTLGYQELQDLLSAVSFVKERVSHAAIGVMGYSMGAAVAIMGAARCPDIQVVVADSPFARQREEVSLHVRKVIRIPHGPLLHIVDFLLGHVGGYHFRDVEPLREIECIAPRPVLLIHGEADSVIDVRDSRILYQAANEPKELWITPGVEHCGTYFFDRHYYCARVASFFRRALTQSLPDIESQPASAR